MADLYGVTTDFLLDAQTANIALITWLALIKTAANFARKTCVVCKVRVDAR